MDEGKVFLRDFDGKLISSFWQYGIMDWKMFYNCLRTIIRSNEDWAVFRYDEAAPGRHGDQCPSNAEVPEPGTYVLLHPDGTPITVDLTDLAAHPRHPTITNTPARVSHTPQQDI